MGKRARLNNALNDDVSLRKRKRPASSRDTKPKKQKAKIDKQDNQEAEIKEPEAVPPVRQSDDVVPKRTRWINKQRVLTCSSRGLSHIQRHLMNDFRSLMPHTKSESKVNIKEDISCLNEICEMRNCNQCLYFENRKKRDLYMWMSNIKARGPSVKFLVLNYYTMGVFKLSGNCLRSTRPLLSFDDTFDAPHWKLMREMLTQIFSTPNQHPKSQPFFDHVFVFSVQDNKIWFRNYQIIEEDGQLAEIGPRFILEPVKIFDGSFTGDTLWSNPSYHTPNAVRRENKEVKQMKRIYSRVVKEGIKEKTIYYPFKGDPTNEYFETEPYKE